MVFAVRVCNFPVAVAANTPNHISSESFSWAYYVPIPPCATCMPGICRRPGRRHGKVESVTVLVFTGPTSETLYSGRMGNRTYADLKHFKFLIVPFMAFAFEYSKWQWRCCSVWWHKLGSIWRYEYYGSQDPWTWWWSGWWWNRKWNSIGIVEFEFLQKHIRLFFWLVRKKSSSCWFNWWWTCIGCGLPYGIIITVSGITIYLQFGIIFDIQQYFARLNLKFDIST